MITSTHGLPLHRPFLFWCTAVWVRLFLFELNPNRKIIACRWDGTGGTYHLLTHVPSKHLKTLNQIIGYLPLSTGVIFTVPWSVLQCWCRFEWSLPECVIFEGIIIHFRVYISSLSVITVWSILIIGVTLLYFLKWRQGNRCKLSKIILQNWHFLRVRSFLLQLISERRMAWRKITASRLTPWPFLVPSRSKRRS